MFFHPFFFLSDIKSFYNTGILFTHTIGVKLKTATGESIHKVNLWVIKRFDGLLLVLLSIGTQEREVVRDTFFEKLTPKN